MKAVVLYRPNSDHSRVVEDYVRDFNKRQPAQITTVSLNTRDGAAMASLYDIQQYPCVMLVREDGQLVREWQGTTLPLFNDVAAYLVGQPSFATV